MGEQYPIGTLYAMADIPDEAMPRFMAELPSILAEVRRLKGIIATWNEQFPEVGMMRPDEPSWVDDDLGEVTVSVAMPDTDETLSNTRKMGGPRS